MSKAIHQDPSLKLSVISPVFLGAEILETLVERIGQSVSRLTDQYEIVLVDDRSPDSSWRKIAELSCANKHVRGLRLSRNFGQHAAISAGLEAAHGEWIVVMDCDLQDPPEGIERLYETACKGYDVVFARRVNRQDSFIRRAQSRIFSGVLSYLTDSKFDPGVANFGIFHRRVIQAVCSLGDQLRFFPGFVHWVGFRATTIETRHDSRLSGASSYSMAQLLKLALNVIFGFSTKPLKLIIVGGLTIAAVAILFGFWIVWRTLHYGIAVEGWASLMVSLWFFAGVIIAAIGFVGLYVGRTFEQTKVRPTFIVAEETESGMPR